MDDASLDTPLNANTGKELPEHMQWKKAILTRLWSGGWYSFALMEIEISDYSFTDFQTKGEESGAFPTLVHEYIHYLQTFTTTWGFTNFYTFLGYILNSFITAQSTGQAPRLPLRNNIPEEPAKTFENFMTHAWLGLTRSKEGFYFEPTSLTDFTLIEKRIEDPYFAGKSSVLYWVVIQGKLIPLTPIVLSENMAIVSSYLASGQSLAESQLSIDDYPLEYNCIHKYIRNYLPGKNTLYLTYILSEAALLVPSYSQTIYKFLRYLSQNAQYFALKTEEQIIASIFSFTKFNVLRIAAIKFAIEQLDERRAIFNKHAEGYGFLVFIDELLSVMKEGLLFRISNASTYAPNLDMTFLNSMVSIIKSPLIRFKDGATHMLGTPDSNFRDAVAFFNGILKVYYDLYSNSFFNRCPFADPESLCSHTRQPECFNNALQVPSNPVLKNCILYNALKLLGLNANTDNAG